ncbi:MAG: hypothetical protein K2I76_00795, partial [Malacoplasma sp.]|nr:hypothetical protein [Malacoplasma sp.]
MKRDNSFIKDFKLKNFLPFYIEEVNDKFFSGTNNTITKSGYLKSKKHKMIAKLNSEESSKFFDSQAILDHNNIKYLLNQVVWKMVAKTGNKIYDLFSTLEITSWKQPMFVFEKFEFEDLKIIGNVYSEKRYIYCLNVDPQSYLYDFVEQIEIAFVIDDKKKSISGGFSLVCGELKKLEMFGDIIEKFYLNSMVKSFILKEIYPLSVNNILGIMDLYEEDDFKNKKNKSLSKNKILSKKSLDELKNSWKEYLNEKIFNKDNSLLAKKREYLENDYFFAFLNIILS